MARINPQIGAHKQRLFLRQGDSFSFSFQLEIDGEEADFTDCAALLQIRRDFNETGEPLIELTETNGVTFSAPGTVTITLTPAQTQELGEQFRRARFQLRVTDLLSNLVVTILRGEICAERSLIQ